MSAYDVKTRYPLPPEAPAVLTFPETIPPDATLYDLNGFWLHIECDCGRSMFNPFRLLAAQLGWTVRLNSVVPKLRCKQCGNKPSRISVVDAADRDSRYVAPAKRIVLVGPDRTDQGT